MTANHRERLIPHVLPAQCLYFYISTNNKTFFSWLAIPPVQSAGVEGDDDYLKTARAIFEIFYIWSRDAGLLGWTCQQHILQQNLTIFLRKKLIISNTNFKPRDQLTPRPVYYSIFNI